MTTTPKTSAAAMNKALGLIPTATAADRAEFIASRDRLKALSDEAAADSKARLAKYRGTRQRPMTVARAVKLHGAEANGIKRPLAGKTGLVWEFCDRRMHDDGVTPTREWIFGQLVPCQINPHTIGTQYKLWRKFYGIAGRLPKAA